MGELKNCASCGKIFVQVTRNICPECIKEEEQEFIKVRYHIKQYGEPSVEEITESTGVDEKKILRWMREGRLEYSIDVSGTPGLTCKRCGMGINIGEYCPACINLMVAQLRSHCGPEKKEPAPKSDTNRSYGRERMFVKDRLRKE